MFTRAWTRFRDAQAVSVDVQEGANEAEIRNITEELEHVDLTRDRSGRNVHETDDIVAFSREHSPAPLPASDLSGLLEISRPPPLAPELLVNVEVCMNRRKCHCTC